MANRSLLRWEAERRGGDRHVRRDSGDEYAIQFLSLLPQGQAWPREPGGTLWRACWGLAKYWGWVDGRAADLLTRESDPRHTLELLSDWERAWGLPDPCFPDATTIGERQRMLVMKMTWQGAQSREYFQRIMRWLGFEIKIREFAPFMVGISRVGDTRPRARTRYERNDADATWMPVPGDALEPDEPDDNFRWYLGPPEIRFAWSANVGQMGLVWFRVVQNEVGVDPHLQFRPEQDLQCLLNRWRPAHTTLVMSFQGLAFGDPMQGTNGHPYHPADH